MSTFKHDLQAGSRSWASVEFTNIGAVGRLAPVLMLWVDLKSPTERIETELHHLVTKVMFENEVIGKGTIIGKYTSWHGISGQIEIPTTQRMLQFVTSRLSNNSDVPLKIFFDGLIQVKWNPNDTDAKMAGDPEPGEVKQYEIHGSMPSSYNIPRSDWYNKVIQPIGDDNYLYFEVAIPKRDTATQWNRALTHLQDAEKVFALGDDAGVFSKLKAMFEALPGAPHNIFDSLPSPKKEELNQLVKSFVGFINHGRHVSKGGDSVGLFPVDRLDSENAIAITKVFVSYISRSLSAIETTS